ncbi:hypothetical protein [Listeria booriae]|uniref:hypothetical protein n=1 Tax=Listeria booriae TaxID=1552123 RepID=UPI001623FF86|nr:hypothetical protein [Listeria booriae]MBC2106136.1 hypothetical protein [Listeria booriae]
MEKRKLNRFQEKKVTEELKVLRKDKDLDKLQQQMYDMCTVYGLSNAEVSSLLFSVMNRILHCEHNKESLLEMDIDITKAGVDTILEIQKMLVYQYAKTLGPDGKPKK